MIRVIGSINSHWKIQMNTETTTEKPEVAHEKSKVGFMETTAETSCEMVGFIGMFKATGMHGASDIFLCLLASVAAFGMAWYIHSKTTSDR